MKFREAALTVLVSLLGAVAQNYQYGPPTTPDPRNYHPPAPLHYVNIGQKLNGDYKFGYDTGKGPNGQSFREETRLPDGTIKGQYGILDANGQQRIIRYTAGKDGFKVEGDGLPQPPANPHAQPAYNPPQRSYQPPPQRSYQPRQQQYYQPPPQQYQPPPQQYQPPPQQYQPPPQQHYQPPPQQHYQPQYNNNNYNNQNNLDFSPYRYSHTPSLQTIQRPRNSPYYHEDEKRHGPPVIDAALLSYNIGVGGR